MTATLPLRRAQDRPRERTRTRPLALPGERTGTATALLVLVGVLVFLGLVMVLSASSVASLEATQSTWSYAVRQATWAGLGTLGLILAARSDRAQWRRYCRVALVAVVGMLGLVLIPGVGLAANGARRWLGAGPVQLQPSELAKVAVILFCADLLARRHAEVHDPRRTVWPVVGVLGGISILILLQPNLGTTLVIGTIVVALLYAAGARIAPLVALGGLAVAATALLVWFEPYRRRRLFATFDPWSNKSDSGYQLIQAGVGLSDGGLLGLGLGQSKAKYGYLPYAHTDFIFAIIGEELGLLGALAVVAAFVALAFLGVRAASRARDRFSALVATGITTWLVAQAFLNVAVVLGLVPNTGVPLPFLSYGGTSLLVTMVGVGMLVNIARHPRPSPTAGPPR